MKKPKHMPIKSQLRPKKTPVVELALYIIFYTVRFILYSVFRGIGTDAKMSLDMTVLITSSIIVGYIFSQFLLFFVIWSLLTENMYGYCLSVVMMLHNFLITGIVIVQHWNNQCIAVKYWLSGILISASYIVEVCVSTFFIYKRWAESTGNIFQKIGGDPIINRIFSVRQRLKTLTYPTVFLPLVTIKKLYLPSSVFQYNFEYTTIVILGLTGLQYLFVHVKFHDEDLAQRKVAIVITILKIVFTVGLLVATVCHSSLTSKARTISIVVYFDILLVTLVFLHYLWKDMKNFGKGLKKHILFRTRELKL